MNLNSHEALERKLKEVIKDGGSIQDAELAIKDLPQFDRARARTTAITEILTASSVAQVESYRQSPAVEKKRCGILAVRKKILVKHMLIWTGKRLCLM